MVYYINIVQNKERSVIYTHTAYRGDPPKLPHRQAGNLHPADEDMNGFP